MWATSRKIQPLNKPHPGFTIVELLIVIVVIGILAAITIVSFNGVQNRAKASAAQQSVTQANRKVLAYSVQNADQYPADLATAGVTDADTTYQYSVNNASSPRTYCITATNGVFSYYQSNTVTSPTTGGCAGHGQGGVAAITNYVTNPGVEIVQSGYNPNNTSSSVSRSTALFYTGSASLLVQSVNATNGYNGANMSMPVTAGKTYTFSAWVYLNSAYGASGVGATTNGAGTSVKQGNLITTIGTWQRTSVTFTPTLTSNASLYVITPSGSTVAMVGASFYTDSWMFTEGTTLYDFADGGSTNWAWTGPAQASTSTGPPSGN